METEGHLAQTLIKAEQISLNEGESPKAMLNQLELYRDTIVNAANPVYAHVANKNWYYTRVIAAITGNKQWAIFLETQRKPFRDLASVRMMRVFFLNYSFDELNISKDSEGTIESYSTINSRSHGASGSGSSCTNSNCKYKNSHSFDKCRAKGGGDEQYCKSCKAYGHLESKCYRKKNGGGGVKDRKEKNSKKKVANTVRDPKSSRPCTYPQCKSKNKNHTFYDCNDRMEAMLKKNKKGKGSTADDSDSE